jgi:hypothetical protein
MRSLENAYPPPTDYCYECRARVRYNILHTHTRTALDECPDEYVLGAAL